MGQRIGYGPSIDFGPNEKIVGSNFGLALPSRVAVVLRPAGRGQVCQLVASSARMATPHHCQAAKTGRCKWLKCLVCPDFTGPCGRFERHRTFARARRAVQEMACSPTLWHQPARAPTLLIHIA